MSALSGMHIDNAIIHIEGSEIPIMDGSSKPFVELIEKYGSKNLEEKRNILYINLFISII